MVIIFFVIAFFFSMVGLGGGSFYVSMMALFNLPYAYIPPISLICNLIVVSGSMIHYLRGGHHRWALSWPCIVLSIPLSFVGALTPIGKMLFFLLLSPSLLGMGCRLFFVKKYQEETSFRQSIPMQRLKVMAIGGCLGLLAGLVGIGGGIFLSPILLILKWGTPKEIAATSSFFVLVNSLSGLTGQILKHEEIHFLLAYWPLFAAVLCGGQLGSLFGAFKSPHTWIIKGTATIVMLVGVITLYKALLSMKVFFQSV